MTDPPSSTRDAIVAILTDVVPDADPTALDPTADLRDELDIDSMDLVSILAAIEERLGVRVAERDYGEVGTLEALVAYVDARRGADTRSS